MADWPARDTSSPPHHVLPVQELEKFKFVLDYKIRELKLQVEPREAEIRAMRRQIKEVRRCTAGEGAERW